MGMFDTVKYKAPCWKCGTILKDWQSKDGDCTLDVISPKTVNRFYTDCYKCKTWNEYEVKHKILSTKYVLVKDSPYNP